MSRNALQIAERDIELPSQPQELNGTVEDVPSLQQALQTVLAFYFDWLFFQDEDLPLLDLDRFELDSWTRTQR